MLFVWISIPFLCKVSGSCGTEVMQNFLDVCITELIDLKPPSYIFYFKFFFFTNIAFSS